MLTFPNAKINLGLNVISRRPDGYHNLETVMTPIPSHDILEIVESRDNHDHLHCQGLRIDCPPESNLVYKALNAMRLQYDIPPVEMYLDKRTPDGAGLGGGSADAAFAIKGLNELFSLGASTDSMAEIAAGIGADCPFFIHNRTMLCTGTGTELSPIDIDMPTGLWLAVFKPEVSVPTKEAYAGLTPKKPEKPLLTILRRPIDQWQGHLVNDFEPTVFARNPEIRQAKEAMLSHGAIYASMSGSGSAVFGLFADKPELPHAKPFGVNGCYLIRQFT